MRITRKGYYEVYDPDGNYISRHTSRDESYEAITEHGQDGIYTITCPNREVEVLLGIVNQGGGSPPVGGGYTATHYVAPFASVSGATSDSDTVNGTAFASATSAGTPCTLGEAMLEATAGNQVQVSAGVYTGSGTTGSRWIPSFGAANSGTSGNEIVFFAEYPAATNFGSTSLYSDLRKSGTDNPVIGPLSGSDFIIFDGFYADESLCRSAAAGGMFQIGTSEGTQYRRCAFDRGGGAYAGGSLGNCFYLEATISARISDCYFNGTVGDNHNDAGIDIYNSASYIVENCTFVDHGVGCYPKENDAGGAYVTSGIIRNNLFTSGHNAIQVQQGVTTEIHNNLIYGFSGTPSAGIWLDAGPDRTGTMDFNIHNNTIVCDAGAWTALYMEGGCDIATSEFKDNIIYGKTSFAGRMLAWTDGGAAWDWTDWDLNNNCYYEVEGSLLFVNTDGADVTGIGDWRTATGGEANTITSDPEFTNLGANDYTLASNAQAALTASSIGGPVGCYVTGSEDIGVRASPSY